MPPDTTPDRLLEAGHKVFAEYGLIKARTRDICALARANVAAVNYHFGSKEQLYFRVLIEHIRQVRRRYPVDAGVTPESPPEERLQAFLRGIIHQILADEAEYSQDTRLSKQIILELLQPSEHAGVLIEEILIPFHQQLLNVVKELLPEAPDVLVLRCTTGIMCNVIMFRFDPRVLDALSSDFLPKKEQLQAVADSMAEFALGGIKQLRTLYSE